LSQPASDSAGKVVRPSFTILLRIGTHCPLNQSGRQSE
jgi:hypothetical protein